MADENAQPGAFFKTKREGPGICSCTKAEKVDGGGMQRMSTRRGCFATCSLATLGGQ